MNVLLDTNVILDVLLDRQPWVEDSKAVWDACDDGRLGGYVAAFTLPTLFYIARKSAGLDRAHECMGICLEAFEVCVTDREVLEAANGMAGSDFEDNLQMACAERSRLNAIVSRDSFDIPHPPVPVMTPAAVLAAIGRRGT